MWYAFYLLNVGETMKQQTQWNFSPGHDYTEESDTARSIRVEIKQQKSASITF